MKPGRNELCPCGSGKKFKRCCGLAVVATPRARPQLALEPQAIGALVRLVEQNRLMEAEAGVRSLLTNHGDVGMLWKILGVALLRQGKEALPVLRKTAELLPQDAEAHTNLGAALRDQGRWTEALMSLCRALEIDPDSTDALTDAASALRAIGRSEEAVALYRRALRLNPVSLAVQNDLGNALLELGLLDEAVACFRHALHISPADARVHGNLSMALARLGRYQEALVSSSNAQQIDPALSAPHHAMGMALAGLGRSRDAVASYRRGLLINGHDVEALNNLGNALRDLGDLSEAVNCFLGAIDLAPEHAASRYNLGNALLDFGRLDEAAAAYRRALALKPDFAAAHLTLSMVLRRQGRSAEAQAACRNALAIAPHSVEALSFHGELEADEGRFSEAEELFKRAITIDPDFPNPWCSIATHRKMTADDRPWLDGAQSLITKPLPLRHEISLRYALGKYFDDVERYADAFGQYRQANDLTQRFGSRYHRLRMSGRIDAIVAYFDVEQLRQNQAGGHQSERPVFIVGMPRSGTSLAEQILASHPEVFGAGELTFWDRAAAANTPGGSTGLAQQYLDCLSALSAGAKRVVDKMPANFMNVGAIHAAFPQARIIHMQRHPIDTCLSVYFQSFSSTHPYANDLGNLAHYYREYVRITDHWRNVLPETVWLDVPYESLVDDQEAWSRKMLDFIGLPWDPRCLDFHQTRRVVITSSKWQVRQKMNSSSVGRWRHYEPFVEPLLPLLTLLRSHQSATGR